MQYSLPFSSFFPVFEFCHGVLYMRSKDQIPKCHMSILPLCKISQWVMQEVDALVFPALTHDLLWTLTSSEPCDKSCRHLGCQEKHKPGSTGRLLLIQRLFCKSAMRSPESKGLNFRVISASYQLHAAPVSCVIFQKIRWESELLQIKEKWDKEQIHISNLFPPQFINTYLMKLILWLKYFFKPRCWSSWKCSN